MPTCFIGTYRFKIEYFFWRAGSKVLLCNPSTSQLAAPFTEQRSSSPAGIAEYQHPFGVRELLWGFLCGRRALLYMGVIYSLVYFRARISSGMEAGLPCSPQPLCLQTHFGTPLQC